MTAWLLAAAGGALVAALQYLVRGRLAGAASVAAAVARAGAVTLLLALLLDAPAGRSAERTPLVALDASASWLRGRDSSAWRSAVQAAAGYRGDSLLLFGDSVRAVREVEGLQPGDDASYLRPLVDRAAAAGRPLLVITDGELSDPDALDALPGGSRVRVLRARPRPDLAITMLEAPGAAVAGDTIEVRVSLRSAASAPTGTLTLRLGDTEVARVATRALSSHAEVIVPLRVVVRGEGAAVLRAAISAPGDGEPRNDTLAVALERSRAAGAVFASTSPDQDGRFALTVLRGALAVPTRGYLRIAPGRWRLDGSLAPVEEAEVRRALREAPLAVIHGDTSALGDPRRVATGALALVAPPAGDDGEFFATSAPPSPMSGALAGVAWDSLPPLAVSPGLRGDWTGLETRRARTQEARAGIVGTEGRRRVVVVGAAGLWRWRFRGGTSADAHGAVWGSLFDWLLAGRGDARAAVPPEGVVRAGQPVRWRRGSGGDSVVWARLSRRGGDSLRSDSVALRFPAGATLVETPPIRPGVYDVVVPGGAALLVVNESAEWLPVVPSLQADKVAGGEVMREQAPGLRARSWPLVAFVLLLCVEWLLRRRAGFR